MRQTCKYANLALSNKWISLFRSWVDDNAPCSRQMMFDELLPLMPTSIRSGRKLASQSWLLREAFRRVYGTAVIPNVILKPPSKVVPKGYTAEIRQALLEREIVRASDFPHIKNATSLLIQLHAKGEAVRIGKGKYVAAK